MKRQQGFTLIELIVVIAIIAIMAAVAIPVLSGAIDRSKQAVSIADAKEIANAINDYNNLNPTAKLTQAAVNGWTSQGDMEASALGGLSPKEQSGNFAAAIARVQVDGNGIATVSTAVS
jgi:prepilin-type N-terminal cleavage/methylation domain-containing protein